MPRSDQRKTLRLFVAAYPPPETARVLVETLGRLGLPQHRAVPVEQVHLTLQFIGDTPAARLAGTIETVQHATRGISAFELTIDELIVLPQRGPARLVAAATSAPAPLLEFHRRLATRLARKTRRDAADRFKPHLTLCRFQAPARLGRIEAVLDVAPFVIDRVALMISTLGSTGAQHDQAASFVLVAAI